MNSRAVIRLDFSIAAFTARERRKKKGKKTRAIASVTTKMREVQDVFRAQLLFSMDRRVSGSDESENVRDDERVKVRE